MKHYYAAESIAQRHEPQTRPCAGCGGDILDERVQYCRCLHCGGDILDVDCHKGVCIVCGCPWYSPGYCPRCGS